MGHYRDEALEKFDESGDLIDHPRRNYLLFFMEREANSRALWNLTAEYNGMVLRGRSESVMLPQ
jgi:hypothetical protein